MNVDQSKVGRNFYDRNVIVAPVWKTGYRASHAPSKIKVKRRRHRMITNKAAYPASDESASSDTDWERPMVPLYLYDEHRRNRFMPDIGRRMYKCKEPEHLPQVFARTGNTCCKAEQLSDRLREIDLKLDLLKAERKVDAETERKSEPRVTETVLEVSPETFTQKISRISSVHRPPTVVVIDSEMNLASYEKPKTEVSNVAVVISKSPESSSSVGPTKGSVLTWHSSHNDDVRHSERKTSVDASTEPSKFSKLTGRETLKTLDTLTGSQHPSSKRTTEEYGQPHSSRSSSSHRTTEPSQFSKGTSRSTRKTQDTLDNSERPSSKRTVDYPPSTLNSSTKRGTEPSSKRTTEDYGPPHSSRSSSFHRATEQSQFSKVTSRDTRKTLDSFGNSERPSSKRTVDYDYPDSSLNSSSHRATEPSQYSKQTGRDTLKTLDSQQPSSKHTEDYGRSRSSHSLSSHRVTEPSELSKLTARDTLKTLDSVPSSQHPSSSKRTVDYDHSHSSLVSSSSHLRSRKSSSFQKSGQSKTSSRSKSMKSKDTIEKMSELGAVKESDAYIAPPLSATKSTHISEDRRSQSGDYHYDLPAQTTAPKPRSEPSTAYKYGPAYTGVKRAKPANICDCDQRRGDSEKKPMQIGYATTIVSRFPSYTVYEILRPNEKKPHNLSHVTENVFVVKNRNFA